MKKLSFISILLISLILIFGCTTSVKQTPESLGWKLGYQSYTFRLFTFEEGLEKAKSLGLKYVEAYDGQKLSSANEAETKYVMNEESREEMKTMLQNAGIQLVNFGVVMGKDEAEWKQIFDFAKEMGIETITAEPNPEHLEYIDSLCNEYSINLAIHNHPQPSRYWTPDSVLIYTEGRSNRIGACADIGHWVRSGLNSVECLQKLDGKIISLHFKDLNEKTREAHDVPWGTGVCDVPAVLAELKRQGFKGVFSIEYEHNWENSVPEIAESIENFKKITSELK